MAQGREKDASEPLAFGLERDLTYSSHLTPAVQFVTLPKRTFASADETHIRLWGADGDIAKLTFASNQRSMVSALAYCPTFSMLITGEMDLTVKCYSMQLDLVESFPLEQARQKFRAENNSKGEKKLASGKVTALACLSGNSFLTGSECGCELWQLEKTRERRANTARLRGLEYRLHLHLLKQVTTEAVHRIIPASEQRTIVAGKKEVNVYDGEMSLIASCFADCVCSAYIHVISPTASAMLTGTADGTIHYWSIQAFDAPDDAPGGDGLCTRLEHTFHGHIRPVEHVSFYHRLEKDVRQRLAVSCALDGKLQVWSLETFAAVYSLDIGVHDSKAHLFSIAPHVFASSYPIGGSGEGRQSASITVFKFTAHLATPFATTYGSPVVQIVQSPEEKHLAQQVRKVKQQDEPSEQVTSSACVLMSEDMAIRIVSCKTRQLLSTLPPPPNSKVQVLEAFLCPIWQLLILWLSSEEVAIFFIPSPNGDSKQDKDKRDKHDASTPLLLRRFGIVEVRTQMLDKDLSRESFSCMSLFYGPLTGEDTLMNVIRAKQASERAAAEAPMTDRPSSRRSEKDPTSDGRDWFLLVGTKLGTMQAFRIADILDKLQIWPRLASHLPGKVWKNRNRFGSTSSVKTPRDLSQRAPKLQEDGSESATKADLRLKQIEEDHLKALENSRAPGQRPFPKGAEPIMLFGRWRRHNYPIEVMKSVAGRILTIDSKHNLHIYHAATHTCTFRFQLNEHNCLSPYVLQPSEEADAASSSSRLELAGVVLGTARGTLELCLIADDSACDTGDDALPEGEGSRVVPETEVILSHASHGGAVIQVDYWLSWQVFASVGKDDAVRIWSSRLEALREITFPQACSSVTFVRQQGTDSEIAYGDILLGFAAHVELVPLDVWARGIDKRKLGGTVDDEHLLAEPSPGTTSGSAFSGVDPQVMLNQLQMYSSQAFTDHSAGIESGTSAVKLGEARVEAAQADMLVERIRTGFVNDFRGPAIVPVGSLCNGAADMAGVEARFNHQTTQPKTVEHDHTQVLDQGDFRAITRCYPGYYDWTVNPSALVDAPRSCAIRGLAGDGNVATVTSIGLGHLRNGRRAEKNAGESAQAELTPAELCNQMASQVTAEALGDTEPQLRMTTEESAKPVPKVRDLPSLPTASASAAMEEAGQKPNAAGVTEPTTPRKPNARPPSAPPRRPYGRPPQASPAAEAAPVQATSQASKMPLKPLVPPPQAPQQEEPPEVPAEGEARDDSEEGRHDEGRDEDKVAELEHLESWRNRRVARGIPRHANAARPVSQNIANSESDVAIMLKERGKLTDAPEDNKDENVLNRIGVKKTEWTYCGTDGNLAAVRRRAVRGSQIDCNSAVMTWSANGRLKTGSSQPPQKALPSTYLPKPPEHMRQRAPMTRSEVTEQKIIQAAQEATLRGFLPGKAETVGLELQSQEFFDLMEQQRLAAAGRSSKASSASSTRSPSIASMCSTFRASQQVSLPIGKTRHTF